MKTLKEIRLEYIKLVLEDSGWDFKKASGILKIPESRLHREARNFSGLSIRREEVMAGASHRREKKK